jgi:hypothetical protein
MHVEQDEGGKGDVDDEAIQGGMGVFGHAAASAQSYST